MLEGKWPQHKELKTAFVLQPVEGSGLPSLLQSRLNAPRVLEVGGSGQLVLLLSCHACHCHQLSPCLSTSHPALTTASIWHLPGT